MANEKTALDQLLEYIETIKQLPEEEIIARADRVQDSELYHDVSKRLNSSWKCELKVCKICGRS